MSSSELISLDPCTQGIVWQGPIADKNAVDQAVAKARQAAPSWGSTAQERRQEIAQAFATLARERKTDLAKLIARETGKPLWEAETEVDSVAGKIDISVRAQAERAGTQTASLLGSVRQSLRHKPHGVLAVLGPYNFPMHLANGHIVPGLLAGNCIVFKPSELTPACGLAMADLWQAAGLPEGVLTVINGDATTGRALSGHADIDGLLFTGSAATGKLLHQQFSGQPHKILALEMGGNNPLIVWSVADIEAAALLIAQSAFLSAGQRCTCARRLIIQAGYEGDVVLGALLAVTDRLIVGAPFDNPAPFMGPVIDNRAAEHLLNAQEELLARGGRSIKIMTRPTLDRPFLSPGIIDVTPQKDRSDEEYFGPLLQVIRVTDFAAALDVANNTRFGLSAGLISDDEALYHRFWAASRAGVVNWNRPLTGASSAAPFGGIGASGNHRPSAYYAADYCAYPVASLEQPHIETTAIKGLRP